MHLCAYADGVLPRLPQRVVRRTGGVNEPHIFLGIGEQHPRSPGEVQIRTGDTHLFQSV
jgi:hypothetical protein